MQNSPYNTYSQFPGHSQHIPQAYCQPMMMNTTTGFYASPTPAFKHPQSHYQFPQSAMSLDGRMPPQPPQLSMSVLVASPTGGFATPPASNNSTMSHVSNVSTASEETMASTSTISLTSNVINSNPVSLTTPTPSAMTPNNGMFAPALYPFQPHAVVSPPASPYFMPSPTSADLHTAWMTPQNIGYVYSPPTQRYNYQPVYTNPNPKPFRPSSKPYYPRSSPYRVPQMNVNYSPPPNSSSNHEMNMNSVQTNSKYDNYSKKYHHEESHSEEKKSECSVTTSNHSRPRFRTRCKACSAPISRGIMKEVNMEDIEEAFADRNETLAQLPEFFGEPQLNFPEIVYYMRIFEAEGRGELQYFKVPRPTKERELHVDGRLAELFLRNYGYDYACEAKEFHRLPVHVNGICQARMTYRQTIVDSLLPNFLRNVQNMDEAKSVFQVIFRYVGCATPKDISANIPQVWTAMSHVDNQTSCEITGVVSLFNYHLFRRMIVRKDL